MQTVVGPSESENRGGRQEPVRAAPDRQNPTPVRRDLRERRLSVKGSAHCPEAVQQTPCEKADADQRHPRSAGPVAANVEDPAGSPTQLSLPEPEMGGYRQDGAADQRPETRPAANTPGNQEG